MNKIGGVIPVMDKLLFTLEEVVQRIEGKIIKYFLNFNFQKIAL